MHNMLLGNWYVVGAVFARCLLLLFAIVCCYCLLFVIVVDDEYG